MRFSDVFIVLSISSISRAANGMINIDIIKELIAPANPIVNRFRRMEDAHGDPLAVLDTVGLVEQHGYPAEEHNVTTKDGYNIVFFRIPGSPKSPPKTGKPMVFMQHGLFLSSDSWVLMGPKNDLGTVNLSHRMIFSCTFVTDRVSAVYKMNTEIVYTTTTERERVHMSARPKYFGIYLNRAKLHSTLILPSIVSALSYLDTEDLYTTKMNDQQPAFLLADAGYDVWIGNVRGNTYARSHKHLTTLDNEFWNFSFDEIGSIDTLSLIDYALEYSGQKKFFYIGHSMGTVISYVILTERPDYNDKMRLVVSLAPPAFWEYDPGPFLRLLAQNSALIETFTDALGIDNFLPQSRTIAEIGGIVCGDDSPIRDVCLSIYHLIDGQPAPGFNNSALPGLFRYFPAGTSRKTVFHFLQSINLGASSNRKFDYGATKNLMTYGTRKPPVYDVSKISAPVALFYGQTDELVQAPNIIGLAKYFSNLVTCEGVPSPAFSHLDFIWSQQAKDILYPRIIDLLSKYSN